MANSSGSSFCAPCGSYFHTPATCPQQQPATYTPVSNAGPYNQQAVEHEWHYRSLFAAGIPHDKTPSCGKHTAMRLQTIGQLPSGYSEVPLVKDAFRTDFVATRTLLPLCKDCLVKESDVQEPVPGLDQCKCATKIATAECSQCIIAEINGTVKFASKKRSPNTKDPAAPIKCRCGKPVAETELQARQCVYCKGIATAPFRNYAGARLVYASTEAAMPRAIASESEQQALPMEYVDSVLEVGHGGDDGSEGFASFW